MLRAAPHPGIVRHAEAMLRSSEAWKERRLQIDALAN
jgi:hypothetical protein